MHTLDVIILQQTIVILISISNLPDFFLFLFDVVEYYEMVPDKLYDFVCLIRCLHKSVIP
jgi:hypothetical protein